MIVLPIGLAPKTTPGEYRLNFDLSFPQGASINAGILREDSSVSYTRFDEIIHMIRAEGNGSFPFKVNIKSAFRLLPIHTKDFALLGVEFQRKILWTNIYPLVYQFLVHCLKNSAVF